jgi:hypothetical protein
MGPPFFPLEWIERGGGVWVAGGLGFWQPTEIHKYCFVRHGRVFLLAGKTQNATQNYFKIPFFFRFVDSLSITSLNLFKLICNALVSTCLLSVTLSQYRQYVTSAQYLIVSISTYYQMSFVGSLTVARLLQSNGARLAGARGFFPENSRALAPAAGRVY